MIKQTAETIANNPLCPKCKARHMVLNQRAPSGKMRWVCQKGGPRGTNIHCYTTVDPSAPYRGPSGRAKKPDEQKVFQRKLRPGTKRFLITAAQNATPVHKDFWAALQVAAKHLHAEILVIPLRYKNATSRWTASQENAEWWDKAVTPYLWNTRRKLNENIVVLGDLKTQPTASSPLMGFEAMTGSESGVIGHTKLQLRVIPSPSNKFPKILTTTGACTVPNYTDSKAGKLGEFHHMLGAVVIEIESSKTFHMRHLSANKDGSFSDLDILYTTLGASAAPQAEALIMGDTHVDYVCPKVVSATFGKHGIVSAVNPKKLIWHDLLDGYAVNPHHFGNPFNAYAKRHSGKDNVSAEVQRAIEFVRRYTGTSESIIVASNHDAFLQRWILSTDWRSDPTNAHFYLTTALAMLNGTRLGNAGTTYPNPFDYWMQKANDRRIRTLGTDEALTICGVELSMHGHLGPNGSRGSIKNLRRVGLRSIIGHSHTPGIDEGCTQVGTSTRLRLEYTIGPSSWLNAHCILHADGKRQLIFIINGHWRL